MKPVWRFVLCGVVALGLGVYAKRLARAFDSDQHSIQVDNLTRTYLLHVPSSIKKGTAVPLVFVFHGGGGQAPSAERLYGWDKVADREGFIVVYPNGLERQWRDGRDDAVRRRDKVKVDDIKCVRSLLDEVSRTYTIDPKRVYATGMSNGAMFSNFVGANISDKFAAIAPVAGSLAKEFAPRFKPTNPISVFLIHGIDDPIVPYEGGAINIGQQGTVLGAPKTAALWVKANGCTVQPTTGRLPDKDSNDGCQVSWSRWSNGKEGTEVLLYSIKGGGHSWPTEAPPIRLRTNGKVCHDFDATTSIWEYFKAHPKR
jgi:polyhydroxybutyrate depolymerase